jgi:hypothetical protein
MVVPEIAVIKSSCLPDNHYDVIGTVKLCGIVGLPVAAIVIKLPIKMSEDSNQPLSMICAACEDTNEDLLLPSNVVERLFAMQHHVLLYNDLQLCADHNNDVSNNDEMTWTHFLIHVRDDNLDECDDDHVHMNANQNDNHQISVVHDDVNKGEDLNLKSSCLNDVDKLAAEQRCDITLKPCFKLAQRGKSKYLV